MSTWQAIRATQAEHAKANALVEAQKGRTEAQSKADETQAVLDFLINEMLASASPDRHPGQKVTVEDVLEEATRCLTVALSRALPLRRHSVMPSA